MVGNSHSFNRMVYTQYHFNRSLWGHLPYFDHVFLVKWGISLRDIRVKAVRDAIPIVTAYFPIAVTFGVISINSGLSWMITVLISAVVYAGGAQFMLVSLAVTGSSPLSTVITVLLVNLRHFLYGTTLGPAFICWSERTKLLYAFGLTDEVFAVTSSQIDKPLLIPQYQIPFVFVCYTSWITGTAIGALIGSIVPTQVSSILNFSLPALFIALIFIGQRTMSHLFAAISGAIFAFLANVMHWGNIGIVAGAILGATLGMILQTKTIKRPIAGANDISREM
jgi:4-azaleucine resistance transporter AzlC